MYTMYDQKHYASGTIDEFCIRRVAVVCLFGQVVHIPRCACKPMNIGIQNVYCMKIPSV